jgi:hypothetical protein
LPIPGIEVNRIEEFGLGHPRIIHLDRRFESRRIVRKRAIVASLENMDVETRFADIDSSLSPPSRSSFRKKSHLPGLADKSSWLQQPFGLQRKSDLGDL